MNKVDSFHYSIPPKAWILCGGGVSRSTHANSSHAWHKRQAARRARRVSKQLTSEGLSDY